jgi:hypothetical protein
MPALVAGITPSFAAARQIVDAGTSPAMTSRESLNLSSILNLKQPSAFSRSLLQRRGIVSLRPCILREWGKPQALYFARTG